MTRIHQFWFESVVVELCLNQLYWFNADVLLNLITHCLFWRQQRLISADFQNGMSHMHLQTLPREFFMPLLFHGTCTTKQPIKTQEPNQANQSNLPSTPPFNRPVHIKVINPESFALQKQWSLGSTLVPTNNLPCISWLIPLMTNWSQRNNPTTFPDIPYMPRSVVLDVSINDPLFDFSAVVFIRRIASPTFFQYAWKKMILKCNWKPPFWEFVNVNLSRFPSSPF